jgi:superfamily II DNA or RNA helicase
MIENTNVININIKASEELKKYLIDIVNRVNIIRSTQGNRSNNMLQITTDGRKAALDVRLVSKTPTSATKCDAASVKIYEIWKKYIPYKKTQLVFCDYSTPKAGFNIYDEVKGLLINKGIPSSEIAFIHDSTTETKRLALFEKVNRGEIRVLIGSTFKLGTGVNVQKRLIAVHHIDVPWRPSDMIQREGRMLRQGNENVEVFIYRYITEQSFDAYSWQILENKQKLISDLISNCINIRECNDIDDSVLTYSEVKALAVGNPLLKTRFEIDNELNRYYLLEKNDIESKNNARNEIAINISKLEEMKALEENLNLDLQLYIPNQAKRNKTEQNIRNELGRKIIELANENIMKDERTYIDDYLGFKIYLPEKMLDEKKYIVLEGNALHFVDVGYSNTGVMLRIDNALDGIQERITKLLEEKEKIVQRQVELNALLDVVVSYENDIKKTKNKLEKINKQLNIA